MLYIFLLYQTLVHPTYIDSSSRKPGLPVRISQSSCKFSGGQLTHQLKRTVSKSGHVNNLRYWSVNSRVNCSYKRALIGWHPINLNNRSWGLFRPRRNISRHYFLIGWTYSFVFHNAPKHPRRCDGVRYDPKTSVGVKKDPRTCLTWLFFRPVIRVKIVCKANWYVKLSATVMVLLHSWLLPYQQ